MAIDSRLTGFARVPGERPLSGGVAVFARLCRIRPFIAAWVMAGTLALMSAAVALAETSYSH